MEKYPDFSLASMGQPNMKEDEMEEHAASEDEMEEPGNSDASEAVIRRRLYSTKRFWMKLQDECQLLRDTKTKKAFDQLLEIQESPSAFKFKNFLSSEDDESEEEVTEDPSLVPSGKFSGPELKLAKRSQAHLRTLATSFAMKMERAALHLAASMFPTEVVDYSFKTHLSNCKKGEPNNIEGQLLKTLAERDVEGRIKEHRLLLDKAVGSKGVPKKTEGDQDYVDATGKSVYIRNSLF
jgi:hypothetical protein